MIPVYHRPEVKLPARFSSPPGAAEQQAAPAANPAGWWKAFGSEELDALVARGMADGYDLRIALHRLEQARARIDLTGPDPYPTVSATFDVSRGKPASGNQRVLGVQAGIDLDPWGRNDAVTASAREAAYAARFDADAVRANLVASIANAYFQSLSLNERLRLAQLIANDAEQTLALVQTQARLGVSSELEVAQQRNALQTFQAAMPALRQQRDQATGELAVLIGSIPEELRLSAQDLREVRVPDVADSVPADAIARLPEVRAAEALLKAANFDIGAARAAFLPSISLSAQIGAALNPAQALWSVAGSVLQPLFDSGQLKGQLRMDRAHAEELVVTYKLAIAQALKAIENQMSATTAARDAERLNAAAVVSAQRSLELARIRLAHGATDFLTVLVSERTRYQAEDTALQARLLRLQATVGLFRALGTGQPDSNPSSTTTSAKETS